MTTAPGPELTGRFGGRIPLAAFSVAAGLAIIVGAAFWGYRTQTRAWPAPNAAAAAQADTATTPPAAAPAMQRQSASAPRPAKAMVAAGTPAKPGAAVPPEPLKWPLWEFLLRQPMPARNPPLTPVAWRLIGATQSAGTWSIIVMRQGKAAPEYFKTGDSLPGGYRVESITEEDVTLVKGNRPVTLSYIGAR